LVDFKTNRPKVFVFMQKICTFAAENKKILKKRQRFFPTHQHGGSFLEYDLLYIETIGSGRQPSAEPVVRKQVQPTARAQLDYHRVSGLDETERRRHGG
jgi:hypothetical protein